MTAAAFDVGGTIRRLRQGKYNLEDAAGEADIRTNRLQRIETKSDRLNRALEDVEKVARVLGMTLHDLIEKARVRR